MFALRPKYSEEKPPLDAKLLFFTKSVAPDEWNGYSFYFEASADVQNHFGCLTKLQLGMDFQGFTELVSGFYFRVVGKQLNYSKDSHPSGCTAFADRLREAG